MDGYIYRFTNKLNGKVYIGKTVDIEDRYRQHIRSAKNKPSQAIHFAIAKYGIENFTFDILHKADVSMLDELEMAEIEKHNSYHDGYNNTHGGEGCLGLVHTEDSKRLIGEKSKQRPPESNRRISEAQKGRKMSAEELQKRAEICRNIAGKAAVEWHKSPEGLAWHKEQGDKLRGKDFKPVLEHTCKWCGKTYFNKSKKDTFCSGACRQKDIRQKQKYFSKGY
jgi:group I intron endonuclease